MIDHFVQFVEGVNAQESQSHDWLSNVRELGRKRLATAAMPTTKDEEWRFTNLARLPTEQLRYRSLDRKIATALSRREKELLAAVTNEEVSTPIILINGLMVEDLSGSAQWPVGLRIHEISARLPEQGQEQGQFINESSLADEDPFLFLNQAMVPQGIRLELTDAYQADKPIHIVWLYTRASAAMVASRRNFIVAGPRSKGILLETTLWTDDVFCLTNCVSHLLAAEGAELEHVQYWQGHEESYVMSRSEAVLLKGASYRNLVINGGGAWSRNNLRILLKEPHAAVKATGIYGLAGHGQVDNYSSIEHQASDTLSMQLYKGLLAEKSRGVFRGRIKVEEKVTGAEASQLNKNILLGKEARVNSMPWLEIDASDITCEHGATTGTIDAEQLFYLISRGISPAMAREILLKAFIGEALSIINDPWLKEKIDEYSSLVFEQIIPPTSVPMDKEASDEKSRTEQGTS